MSKERLRAELVDFATRWNDLERRLKSVEAEIGSVIIEAINKLRYAGLALVEAWSVLEKDNQAPQGQQLQAELTALTEHWKNLEVRLKVVSEDTEAVIIPSINELRYAGRRVIDAWQAINKATVTASDLENARVQLVMAKQFVTQADHDVIDAVTSHLTARIRDLVTTYGRRRVQNVISDFDQIFNHIRGQRLSEQKQELIERNGQLSIMIFIRMILKNFVRISH